MKEEAYLGLGSNLGDRADNIHRALSLLQGKTQLKEVSSLYETAPLDSTDQPNFINAVCCVSTELGPHELLDFVKGIELKIGRRPTFLKGPRIIDIDLLLYGHLTLNAPTLTIPHVAMVERAFVLVPLVEIASDLVHPIFKEKASALLEKLGPIKGVCLWGAPAYRGIKS